MSVGVSLTQMIGLEAPGNGPNPHPTIFPSLLMSFATVPLLMPVGVGRSVSDTVGASAAPAANDDVVASPGRGPKALSAAQAANKGNERTTATTWRRCMETKELRRAQRECALTHNRFRADALGDETDRTVA